MKWYHTMNHFACFDCRKSYKLRVDFHMPIDTWLRDSTETLVLDPSERNCPQCGGVLRRIGRQFQTPKRSDIAQWEALRHYYCRFWTPHYERGQQVLDAIAENTGRKRDKARRR